MTKPLKLALNLLWFFFGGGLIAALGWIVAGILLALTVVGLPFAVAAFRIANFAAFPFGSDLVDVELLGEEPLFGTALANLIWIVFAGMWLAILHVMAALACFSTLVGIPFGLAHLKLACVCFAPLGKRIVPSSVAEAARQRHAERVVRKLSP